MKVILLQDIKNIGKKGTIKEVSDGYARNFLFPKKLAEIAMLGSIKKVEEMQKKQLETEKMMQDKLKEMAKKISGQEFLIQAKDKDGKLFGSINAKDIANKLKEKNIEVEAKNIILPHPIKEVGEYSIELNLGDNIKSKIKVVVEGA